MINLEVHMLGDRCAGEHIPLLATITQANFHIPDFF